MQTCSNAAIPAAPSASKNASCGFTATACGATASMIPQQKRATSPRNSTGSRSDRGSSPTTSCERLRSTSPARRSAKVSVATAIGHHGNALGGAHRKTTEGGPAPPSETTCAPALRLERGLELAAGRELRHGRRGDLDALTRARVDALAGGAGGRGELAEAGEVHRVAGLQRLRDRFEESVDGLARVTCREPALLGDLVDELLLGQRIESSCVGLLGFRPWKNPNNAAGYRSTMRICGDFEQVGRPEERAQAHRVAREFVDAALFAVDHTDRVGYTQSGISEGLDRCERGPAGGDDVLDQADALALLEDALELLRRPVLLRGLADDQERQSRLERRRRGERDCAELRSCEAVGVRLVLAHRLGERLAERRQHIGARLEAVLVEVVARAAARAEHEVALEVRGVAQRPRELVPLHHCASSSCAIGSRRSASTVPSPNECIEPSSA